jgi:hypothetical protein
VEGNAGEACNPLWQLSLFGSIVANRSARSPGSSMHEIDRLLTSPHSGRSLSSGG